MEQGAATYDQKLADLGWRLDSDFERGEPAKRYVDASGQLRLTVTTRFNVHLFAYVAFAYWEDWDPEFTDSDTLAAGRREFDAAFHEAVHAAKAQIGDPAKAGQDTDREAFRWVIWRTDRALLVMQQARFDLEFGAEVNCWIEPYEQEDLSPETPLIDWLNARLQGRMEAAAREWIESGMSD